MPDWSSACRYISRPTVSNERLSVNDCGQVVYRLKHSFRDVTPSVAHTKGRVIPSVEPRQKAASADSGQLERPQPRGGAMCGLRRPCPRERMDESEVGGGAQLRPLTAESARAVEHQQVEAALERVDDRVLQITA